MMQEMQAAAAAGAVSERTKEREKERERETARKTQATSRAHVLASTAKEAGDDRHSSFEARS